MSSVSLDLALQIKKPAFYDPTSGLQLIELLNRAKLRSQEVIHSLFDFFENNSLRIEDFERKEGSYSRTILQRTDSGFEVMVARWDKGAVTPIHGHPDFALIYIIKGALKETLYAKDGTTIRKELTTIHRPGEYTYHHGIKGRLDNAIHQVQAMRDSLSLHLYSDDALKGEVFTN